MGSCSNATEHVGAVCAVDSSNGAALLGPKQRGDLKRISAFCAAVTLVCDWWSLALPLLLLAPMKLLHALVWFCHSREEECHRGVDKISNRGQGKCGIPTSRFAMGLQARCRAAAVAAPVLVGITRCAAMDDRHAFCSLDFATESNRHAVAIMDAEAHPNDWCAFKMCGGGWHGAVVGGHSPLASEVERARPLR
jgi:hypothetical protein